MARNCFEEYHQSPALRANLNFRFQFIFVCGIKYVDFFCHNSEHRVIQSRPFLQIRADEAKEANYANQANQAYQVNQENQANHEEIGKPEKPGESALKSLLRHLTKHPCQT